MRSIEWWYFLWPWWTPNPNFTVTAFLKSNISKTFFSPATKSFPMVDRNLLVRSLPDTNLTKCFFPRSGLRCLGLFSRSGLHLLFLEALSLLHDSDVVLACRTRSKSLKNTNRKPYTICRMVPLSMTLSDLWPGFQDHNIFWSRISEKQIFCSTLIGNHT